jgi:hypothetical protein
VTSDPVVDQVFDLVTSYQQAAVVAAAVRLRLLEAVEGGGGTSSDVAERSGTALGPTAALLACLAHLGIVARAGDGRHTLTSAGRRLADPGGLALVAVKEAFFARAWTDLDVVVRTGRPLLRSWAERLVSEPERCRGFLRALRVIAAETGPDLASLPCFAPGTVVLDVGGGLGSYAVPLARGLPGHDRGVAGGGGVGA